MEEVLSWTRVLVSLIFLAYASWSDYRTREVSNNVWVVFAPVAFLLTFAQFLFFPSVGDVLQSMIYYGISFTITCAFSIALFYVGAFGGADAKALICIALAMPLPLRAVEPFSGFVSFIFPITVFSNGVIIAASSVFYALLRNFLWRLKTDENLFEGYEDESFGRKALTLLCGYKVSVAYLKKSFMYPLEDFQTTEQGEIRRHLLLFPKDEEREEIVERIVEAENTARIGNGVWATPGLPMLIFITVGLILALTIGDIVWIAISRVL